MDPADTISIERMHVRARAGAADAALRTRLACLLGNVDLRPPGVPASSVLIVHQMADPLPGRLIPRTGGPQADPAWERAARAALDELYRRAAHPERGQLPVHAPAVLFADAAELLACLAIDLGHGVAWERWWWRVALRDLPRGAQSTLAVLLCREARDLPAALGYLANWGMAAATIASLSPAEALAALDAVGRAYGADLHRALGVAEQPPRHMAGLATPRADVAPPGIRGASDPAPLAPWERCLPAGQIPAGLGRTQACLLGVGLALAKRPALVRDSVFLHDLGHWWATTAPDNPGRSRADARTSARMMDGGAAAVFDSAAPQAGAIRPTTAGERTETPAAEPSPASPPANTLATPARNRRIDAPADIARPAPLGSQPQPAGRPPARPAGAPPRPAHATSDRPVSGRTLADSAPAPSVEQVRGEPVVPALARFSQTGIATDLGGVLFLINLMAHLELPECFESDWNLATQVGSWGVLEALGRGLLRHAPARWLGDAIWAVLAELDGRTPGAPAGAELRGDKSFRLPARWLAQLGDDEGGAFFWGADAARVRVWSAQGYLLLERPVDGAPEAAARAELRDMLGAGTPYQLSRAGYADAPLERLGGPLVARLDPRLRRWLALTLPAVRLRLLRALHRGDGPLPGIERALLQRTGRLHVTATHVDLLMSLDAITLPARLAGFDRDPGWMPDFGRVIKFYFE